MMNNNNKNNATQNYINRGDDEKRSDDDKLLTTTITIEYHQTLPNLPSPLRSSVSGSAQMGTWNSHRNVTVRVQCA